MDEEKVNPTVDSDQERSRAAMKSVIEEVGKIMRFFTQPIAPIPGDPALSAETLNAEGLKRLAAAAPPDVKELEKGLRSRTLADRLTAALWVARFDDKPGFEFLRPLRAKAAGMIADAMNSRTEPVLSAAAVHEIDTELLQLLYDRPGPSDFIGALAEADRKALRSVN